MVFSKAEHLLDDHRFIDNDIPGYQVFLPLVVTWQLQELSWHDKDKEKHIQINLRLDGRSFGGHFLLCLLCKVLAPIPPLSCEAEVTCLLKYIDAV